VKVAGAGRAADKPLRILCGRLEDDGYHTGEYRTARGVMIRLSGSKLSEIADPPAWHGNLDHGV